MEPVSSSRFASANLEPVERVLGEAVRDGAFPGAVAAAGTTTRDARFLSAGVLGESLPAPAGPDTVYDLASLTKIVSATATAMCLARDGRLEITAPVRRYVPAFRGDGRDDVTVEHLLTHASGLPAWKPLHDSIDPAMPYRERVIAAILATPLESPPGTRAVYSDLGAIVLGECLVMAGGKPLATLAWERVFGPLAMRETLYRPPATWRHRTAPTEVDRSWRRRLVHGEVHDENAFAMGGVSAHAGAFSTARDMARFAAEVIDGRRGRSVLFPREVTRTFTTRRGIVAGSSRALGWDTRSERGSSSGHHFSAGSFGHTGFTGTSIWIDPERELFAVLLSNRVHPTRENRKISAVRVRFHDALIESLEA